MYYGSYGSCFYNQRCKIIVQNKSCRVTFSSIIKLCVAFPYSWIVSSLLLASGGVSKWHREFLVDLPSLWSSQKCDSALIFSSKHFLLISSVGWELSFLLRLFQFLLYLYLMMVALVFTGTSGQTSLWRLGYILKK